jgi:subtilisin family serine protease
VGFIAASGNDATTRPFYPAALSPRTATVTGKDRKRVPVVAVGSLNPDGESIALFNNHGPWVREWRPSVSLVSTVPASMRGALQPRVRLGELLPGEAHHRATIDDDDFTGGFAVWSGTSFAAPVLGAEVAGAMLQLASERTWDRSRWLERGWSAVERVTSIRRGGEGL